MSDSVQIGVCEKLWYALFTYCATFCSLATEKRFSFSFTNCHTQ